MHRRPTHATFFTRAVILAAAGALLASVILSPSFVAGQSTGVSAAPSTTLYFPIIGQPDTFVQIPAIWPHSASPGPHEVALFRGTFTLDETSEDTLLHIFADTRYELWVDGVWRGRGPARFSHTLREYDRYQLNNLPPGKHLIAALVQWAPNNRRAESLSPILQVRVSGNTGTGTLTLAKTGPHWKAQLSEAWAQNAAPVHMWDLIGPTELLDLRQYPPGWAQPNYSDAEWQSAKTVDLTQNNNPLQFNVVFDAQDYALRLATPPEGWLLQSAQPVSERPPAYTLRSIPQLAQVPITPTILDTGLLSPAYTLIEIAPDATAPYTIPVDIAAATTISIETLTLPGYAITGTVSFAGKPLGWQPAGNRHPDILHGSADASPGSYPLVFTELPPGGMVFQLSTQGVRIPAQTFSQGLHAGRRLLLAEPVPDESAVSVLAGEGLTVSLQTTPAYVLLELPRTIHGRLLTEVTGPAGTILDIGWDERLSADNYPLPYPGSLHKEWNQTDSWVLDGTTRSLTTLDTRAGRYILLAVWGEGPVTLRNVRVLEERYPVTLQGVFTSSNTLLDQIWQTGVESAYPNMTDAYTDTPWRERGQWWGDAYLIDQLNRLAFGDTALLRRGLLFMAEEMTDGRLRGMAPHGEVAAMLDYGMLWVHSLQEHTALTGDLFFAQQLYPAAQAFLAYLASYEHAQTGLLDIPFGHWAETTYIDNRAYYSRYGQSTAVNAFYYSTLLQAAALAETLGDTGQAAAWEQKAASVKQQVNAALYQSEQGQYLTTIFEGEAYPPDVFAQAWALAYKLVPEGDEAQVADTLLALLSNDPAAPNVSIYGMHWVLEGLARAGYLSEALAIVENYYGYLLDAGATTWWERFDADQYYWASLSHGWGGAPTLFLTNHVLGAQWTAPHTWSVQPAFAGVDHAAGIVPVSGAVLEAAWQRVSCNEQLVELTVPAGTAGDIIVPSGDISTTLTLSDTIIWADSAPQATYVSLATDGIHVHISEAGQHVLRIENWCGGGRGW